MNTLNGSVRQARINAVVTQNRISLNLNGEVNVSNVHDSIINSQEKTSIVDDDIIPILDSEDGLNLKKIKASHLINTEKIRVVNDLPSDPSVGDICCVLGDNDALFIGLTV